MIAIGGLVTIDIPQDSQSCRMAVHEKLHPPITHFICQSTLSGINAANVKAKIQVNEWDVIVSSQRKDRQLLLDFFSKRFQPLTGDVLTYTSVGSRDRAIESLIF